MTRRTEWSTPPGMARPVVSPDGQELRSLNLTIEETPGPPFEAESDCVGVDQLGAVGDGITDDTVAIQNAMNSGKSAIYFQPGVFMIDRPVKVPATVMRINFMYSDLASGETLREMKGAGMFAITGETPDILVVEDLFSRPLYVGRAPRPELPDPKQMETEKMPSDR